MKIRSKLGTNSTKLNKKNKIETSSVNPVINVYQSKVELLFGQKSFLEILLGLIKKTQVDYLTSNTSNNSKQAKNTELAKIKQILNDLKESLTEIKKEKEKKINLFEMAKQQKETNLKKIIFNTVLSKRSVSNFNCINSNYETLITENNENYYNKETPELKLLNFKVENEIKKVENLSKRKLYIIQYYKTPHLIHEHRTEIICEDRRNNESMNQLLHQKLIQQREKFIEIVNMKSLQDMRISNMQSQAIGYKNAMKDIHKSYRYVNTQEVIAEENKSYLETVNEDEKIDEKGENLKNSKNFEEEKDKNNNIINCKERNNINNVNDLKNLKLIDMNEVEKLLKLNMNINVNINYNQQYINNHFDNNNNNKKENEEDNSSDYSKKENIDDNDSDLDKKEKLRNEPDINEENGEIEI